MYTDDVCNVIIIMEIVVWNYVVLCIYYPSVPIEIEQSSVSVFRGERGSEELFALLTWTGLTAEQAGGVLSNTNYTISLYNQPGRTLVSTIVMINV